MEREGIFCDLESVLKKEMFGNSKKAYDVLGDRELSELAFDVLDIIKIYSDYTTGHVGKEHYVKQKKEFKSKWMGNSGVRVKRIVDAAVADLKEDLYLTFGIDEK